uniref:PH domain-containing protein n=1 Tax=Anopheles epiroticus TaxID=199890 RepID=A0A182PW30_9DIPT
MYELLYEHADLNGYSSSTSNKEAISKPSATKSQLAFSKPIHGNKVNIAEASPDDRQTEKEELVLQEHLQQYERGRVTAATSNESLSLDDELEALFGRDWNNNLSGKGVASKVKMMAQQYEQGKCEASRPIRTLQHAGGIESSKHPDVSSIGEAETSDFESASVTSGSSIGGGRRSVRTSSAFSEGSREVASIERFELTAAPSQPQKLQQEDAAAGHNTMITININYRCDTNPLRTSSVTRAEEEVAATKTVDIVVSAPGQTANKEGRIPLSSDNVTEGPYVRDVEECEEQELMDLEREETVIDETVKDEKVTKGDAGTRSKIDRRSKEHRSSLTNNRTCYTPEDEEYHDCDDLHESTLSFYEQACSHPVTPQERSSIESSTASPTNCSDELDGEQPMIRIVQELSEDHGEVTSTISLSKEQIREMQKANGARRSAETLEELKRHSPREEKSSVHEKRRKSSDSATAKKRHDRSNLQRQQRIIDDNFCNEILDSTIHFDRLMGNNRPPRHGMEKEGETVASKGSAAPQEECFSDSVVCEMASSPADESFDSVMSVGKLEGKPRYSGKTVGRLMMKRLKKLQGGGIGTQKTINPSDTSTSSSQQLNGPKKPPRTFADSPKRSTVLPTPSCPTAKDVDASDPSDYEIGWKLDSKPKTHQVGWKVAAANEKIQTVPAQIYSMLNYSEDEGRKKLIKTGNSKPAPQQSTASKGKSGKYWDDGEPVGPKLDIDMVDGIKTPSRRHSTSTDFERFVRESNVKSTPHRKGEAAGSRVDVRRRIESFLSEERQQALERKLPGPDRHPSDRDPNINRNSSVKKKYSLHHKHLGYTPDHLRCKSCGSGRSDALENGKEETIVPANYRTTAQVPSRAVASTSSEDENKENRHTRNERTSDGRRRRSGEEVNRKSARSLNFASVPQEQRQNPSPVEQNDLAVSPRKTGKQFTEPKFLKTLRNLKISPKRMFRFAPQSPTALNKPAPDSVSREGEFQSYDDLNLDNVANMGHFLSDIRRKIDGDSVQTGAVIARSQVPIDVHGGEEEEEQDPIYQEISPKSNKMILNEFISSETNKRYLMVNNNPNILYALVESKSARSAGRLVRSRSLTNVQGASCAGDPTVSSTPVSKPLNNMPKSQMKPSNRRVTMSPHMERFAVDDTEEGESCLYHTALATNSTNVLDSIVAGGSSGRKSGGVDRSLNATGSTAGNSTRRSLFTRNIQTERERCRLVQHQQSTDDSDISILQEEDSGQDADTLESRPGSTPIVEEPLIVRERVEDRLTVRRENERFQQKPPPSSATASIDRKGTGRYRSGPTEDFFAFEKDIIVEEEMGGKNCKDGKGGNLILLKAHKSVQVTVNGNGGGTSAAAAPLGCFDTDGEIESLRKYDDREIEELVHSLHDNVTLSDMGTLDTETTASSSMGNDIDNVGYDTVDRAPPVARVFQQPKGKNQTIDTVDVSELISHAPDDSLSPSNLSPITDSLASTKMSTSGTAVMRNLKDKLRSSFRKSKTFIKNERQRLANYLLEERSSSRSSSGSSSTASSPQKKVHANTIGHTRTVQSPGRRRLERSSDQESDDMYRSFTDGSGSIVTGSSMTELSSQHMSELMQQIIRQGDARKQLKQALAICRSTREFECSPELIEAERLLLVATQKETAVRNELNKIDYQTNGMTLAEGKRVGTVTLSNFEFPLKETAVRDALFNYFYVVVCTYKHEVKATAAKERHADGRVYFNDCAIQFKNLDANYEIKVEVFVLQLRKNVKNYSFESRYHLEKDSKRPLSCPSPSKKLREAGRLLSFRSTSPKTFDFDNEFSRFKSQGFLTLTSFTLLTANGADEGDDGAVPEEEKHFDATYATARTSYNTHLSTMLDAGDEELQAAGNSYYSTTGHFQPVVCRQDDQSVLFIAEEFKYLTLDSMAYTSNMVGTIGMSVRSEVRFDGAEMSGFLDVGEKVEGTEGITWNRRWCKMNGFMLEFWNYPQECQEKQPILYIDLVKCINERIQLADRAICSRPRTLKVEIFSSRVAAGTGASCNSSGIGSFRSTGRTTSPSSAGGEHHAANGSSHDRELLRPLSPGEQRGRGHNNVTCYLLAADTQSDLKGWLCELNRVVKFLKEWKI